jgi:hypothetical protein
MGAWFISVSIHTYGHMSNQDRFEMGEEEYAERLQAYRSFRGEDFD